MRELKTPVPYPTCFSITPIHSMSLAKTETVKLLEVFNKAQIKRPGYEVLNGMCVTTRDK